MILIISLIKLKIYQNLEIEFRSKNKIVEKKNIEIEFH